MSSTGVARAGFTPTVLIVDDDRLVTRRFSREFLQTTALGVVVANSIKEAADLIEGKVVEFDAVLSDLYFDYGTDDPHRELGDGLAFLAWIRRQGIESPLFAISAVPDLVDFGNRSRDLELAGFFDKFSFDLSDSIWMRVQRILVERQLTAGSGGVSGIVTEVIDREAIEAVNKAISRLQLAVRTYLQELPDNSLVVKRPIEVICIGQPDGTVKAYAPALGLLTTAVGEDVPEALEVLADAIALEFRSLQLSVENDFSDYMKLVAASLARYISRDPV